MTIIVGLGIKNCLINSVNCTKYLMILETNSLSNFPRGKATVLLRGAHFASAGQSRVYGPRDPPLHSSFDLSINLVQFRAFREKEKRGKQLRSIPEVGSCHHEPNFCKRLSSSYYRPSSCRNPAGSTRVEARGLLQSAGRVAQVL
jgi:hypothetical protein